MGSNLPRSLPTSSTQTLWREPIKKYAYGSSWSLAMTNTASCIFRVCPLFVSFSFLFRSSKPTPRVDIMYFWRNTTMIQRGINSTVSLFCWQTLFIYYLFIVSCLFIIYYYIYYLFIDFANSHYPDMSIHLGNLWNLLWTPDIAPFSTLALFFW